MTLSLTCMPCRMYSDARYKLNPSESARCSCRRQRRGYLSLCCAVQIVLTVAEPCCPCYFRYVRRAGCLSYVDVRRYWRFALQFAHVPQPLHCAHTGCCNATPIAMQKTADVGQMVCTDSKEIAMLALTQPTSLRLRLELRQAAFSSCWNASRRLLAQHAICAIP